MLQGNRSFKGLYVLEDVNSNSIGVTERVKGNFDSRYKYLVAQFSLDAWPRAFVTKTGYKTFLKVYNLKKTSPVTKHVNGKNVVLCYNLNGRFKVVTFWHKYDLPKDCKHFIGLSNGNYVDCYYADIEGVRVIFKPNPNAKEVYKPLDYSKCAKIYG